MTRALGLLPFFEAEVRRIALFAVHEPTRHLPAVFQVQFSRDFTEAGFVERQINCLHLVGIDPGPHRMSVPPAVLLVEDDGTRLPLKPEALLDSVDGGLEFRRRYTSVTRRIEAQREQVLPSPRRAADGIGFVERAA